MLISAAFVHLKNAELSKHIRNLSAASRAILLSGPTGSFRKPALFAACLWAEGGAVCCPHVSLMDGDLDGCCLCRALPAVARESSVPLLQGALANSGRHRLLASGENCCHRDSWLVLALPCCCVLNPVPLNVSADPKQIRGLH